MKDVSGWLVMDSERTKYRTWVNGHPEWTEDPSLATRYARRIDAEQQHAEDEDAWAIVSVADDWILRLGKVLGKAYLSSEESGSPYDVEKIIRETS